MKTADIQFALEQHDAKIESLGFNIWVGMEPTFTQRFAELPEWLSEALGPQKLQYAYQLLQKIYSSRPGGIVLHTLGRQYAGENQPRWSIGYYRARNNQFSWEGPAGTPFDPHVCADIDIEHFWRALCDQISLQKTDQSWQAAAFKVDDELKYRIVFRCDGTTPVFELKQKPALARPSVHNGKIPLNGLTDDLAEEGDLLLSLGLRKTGDSQKNAAIYLELPSIKAVDIFIRLLLCIADAAKQASVSCLVLQGFPPPVDSTIAWTTITPDPAVVEINQAPSENASSFFKESQLCYHAAEQIGLSSYRLNYTGAVSDSGGGGQFTIGGPAALDSPFIRWPLLLPRLIRYFNAHPALSYWFAPPSIGSSSQSPRLDEGVRESFQELMVALEQLEKAENPQPEFIWRSISPFTVDPSGNPHRSEINIEKLWNPYLPERGCLGLVEFRAFRMPRSAESATAITVLLRAIIALLIQEDKVRKLTNHGAELHDKYALPFYLRTDLQSVFKDLQDSDLGLSDTVESLLLQEPVRLIAGVSFYGCRVELQHALEFWPLVGDVASQEQGGSRMVDGSTSRLQLSIRPESSHTAESLDEWNIQVDGYRLPMRLEQDELGPVMVFGLRYRSFMPYVGLHPGIKPRNTIDFVFYRQGIKQVLKFSYHEWKPDGCAYSGLPENLEDAEQRRHERLVTQLISINEIGQAKDFPAASLSDYCVDLRRVPLQS